MKTKLRYFGIAVTIAASLSMVVTIYKTSGAPTVSSYSQNDNSRDLPVVDFDAEITKEKSKTRKEKDEHFNERSSYGTRAIAELPEGVEPLPIIGAWWLGLSPLPVDQSDVVVRGIIGSREAHLSDDRTGIYSEFTVLVSEVLKDSTNTIISGTPVSANRWGGAARFKSGKLQKYRIARQGMPQVGAEYVLFLRKSPDGDLLILTGYDLAGGHINPLDGDESKDPRMVLPFAKYLGADQADFLKELRDAAARLAKATHR